MGICRAIQHGSSLLIFDEPTSSLSGAETEEVFRIVRTLRARGMGVIYITHRLEELRAIGDRVTILRDGATVHTRAAGGGLDGPHHPAHGGPRNGVDLPAAAARAGSGAAARRRAHAPAAHLHDVSFSLRAGRDRGAGRPDRRGQNRNLPRHFRRGSHRRRRASSWMAGRRASASPREAVAAGIALVTEDRQKTGLALRLAHRRQHHHGEPAGDQPAWHDSTGGHRAA